MPEPDDLLCWNPSTPLGRRRCRRQSICRSRDSRLAVRLISAGRSSPRSSAPHSSAPHSGRIARQLLDQAVDPADRWVGLTGPRGAAAGVGRPRLPGSHCCGGAATSTGEGHHVAMTEMPLPEGESLTEVAREAAVSGQVVFLTDRGRRLAAIVPADLAELLERTGEAAPGRRVLGARAAGRSGRHDVSERIEEILRSEVAS